MFKIAIVSLISFSSFAGAWFSGNLIVHTEAGCSAVFALEQSAEKLIIGTRTYACPEKEPVVLPSMAFVVSDSAVLLNGESVGASTEQIIKISNWSKEADTNFSFVIYPMPGSGGGSSSRIWDNYKSVGKDPVGFTGLLSQE